MQAKQILKDHGLRYTPHRGAIIDLIAARSPLSAEEIYTSLPLTDKPNLSTVYRALDALTAKGILERFTLSDIHKHYYALHSHAHQHYFLCTHCHQRIEVTGCPLSEYQRTLQETLGLEITAHSLQLSGLCSDCKGKKR